MNQSEVLAAIGRGEDGYSLLLERIPGAKRRFDRIVKQLSGFLADVRAEFPDAEFYTGGGGLNLLLGNSHDDNANPQQDLVALVGKDITIGDGDW